MVAVQVKATGAPYTRCCGLVRTMPAVEHDVNLQSSNAVRPAFQVGAWPPIASCAACCSLLYAHCSLHAWREESDPAGMDITQWQHVTQQDTAVCEWLAPALW